MNYKPLILVILMLLIFPSIFSYSTLSLDSTSDGYGNTFYISKNISKEIYLTLDSDISSSLQNNYRAEYSLKVYSQDLKEIQLSLSKQEETFVSNVNSYLSLNIRSLDFNDQTVNLRVSVSIYDSLNNLVDTDYIFLKLVSNNSEYDFSGAPKNKVPEYSGYSLSRDKMFILHKYDIDTINIKNHISSIVYGVKCSSKEQALLLDLRYQGGNEYLLEASIDSNLEIKEGFYNIDCFAFNKDDKQNIKTITLNYLDQETTLPLTEEIVLKESKLKVFFNKLIEKIKQ